MNDIHLRERMMERLLATQTPLGRLRLNCYVVWKRFAWTLVIRSTLFIKRFFDIIASACAILLLLPVFAVLAILVKLDGGPVFFRQTRIGFMGREFKMIKYRSMVVDAEARIKDLAHLNEHASGVMIKLTNDPRVTRVGRILRKSSLDELPQFWNVLLGDMSLVGPRPPIPREVALYTQADRRRFLVKPGITCLWQVGERQGGVFEIGSRHNIDFPEQVSLDMRYIESQSIVKDLWILAKTIPAILFGRGF
jgi:lipopolysaccharide/colanic/teichoic acid biosynthesis glycosyltransferase